MTPANEQSVKPTKDALRGYPLPEDDKLLRAHEKKREQNPTLPYFCGILSALSRGYGRLRSFKGSLIPTKGAVPIKNFRAVSPNTKAGENPIAAQQGPAGLD